MSTRTSKLKGKAKKAEVKAALLKRGLWRNGHYYSQRNRRHRLANG